MACENAAQVTLFAELHQISMVTNFKAVQSCARAAHCTLWFEASNFPTCSWHFEADWFGISKTMHTARSNECFGVKNKLEPSIIWHRDPDNLSKLPWWRPGDGSCSAGSLKIGKQVTVWSLGCILYELVYESPPFASLE